MERREKLHESILTVHQRHEPHMADKNDEKKNDDSWAANPGLFLVTLNLPALSLPKECFRTSSHGPVCSNRRREHVCSLALVLVCTWIWI